jgi:pimeloyl-ACP methyl ester carboxylesterase
MKKVTSKDGTKIAYDKIGQGPVVILVLGALNSRKSGAELAKLLAAHFTVISYDRRGRGDSTDTPPYAPQREIEDLAALIHEVGGQVYLYGHSSGAGIVFEAAIQLHNEVKKIAIYEAPYSLGIDASKAAGEYDKQLKRLITSGRKGDAVALLFRNAGMSDKQIQDMKRMPSWRGFEALAPTLAYDSALLGVGHRLPTTHLAGINTPTLVMHGGASSQSMHDAAQAISAVVPEAQLLTLAGQTHHVSPEVIAPVLAEFFSASKR